MKVDLMKFIEESNRIERIDTPVTPKDVAILKWFITLPEIKVSDVSELARYFQPDAELRDRVGMNVVVGNHVPVGGSPTVRLMLADLLNDMDEVQGSWEGAYTTHHRYEKLHPYTDCNGRTGRALWLWTMQGEAPLGFLHTWYYQSLSYGRAY